VDNLAGLASLAAHLVGHLVCFVLSHLRVPCEVLFV
jgi:hypothetical protein